MSRCFVVTPLGFEIETEREIQECWPDLLDASGRPHAVMSPEFERYKGGVEMEIEPFTAVQLNFFLKTANRVLIRLDKFKARDFPKLHEKLGRLNLKSWIGDSPVRFEVSAGKSRLGHEGRIRETAVKAWKVVESDSGVRVFIRIQDDVCEVSLDSTGEHLHKRGIQTHRGEAPLRENIAAFCLRRLIGTATPGEITHITLIDPMCGSGTFLAEAATLWTPNFHRRYSLQSFGKLPKLFKQENFQGNFRFTTPSPFLDYRGFDLTDEMVKVAQRNLELVALHPATIPKPRVTVGRRDVLAAVTGERSARNWVIMNPPYGERIEGPPFDEILKSVRSNYSPERVAMLVPAHAVSRLRGASESTAQEIPVLNGGIDCRLMIWDFKSRTTNPSALRKSGTLPELAESPVFSPEEQ